MFKLHYLVFVFFCSSVLAQHTKKQLKTYAKEIVKEYSREHIKDFRLIMDVLDSSKKVSSVRYQMKSIERIESGLSSSTTKVK